MTFASGHQPDPGWDDQQLPPPVPTVQVVHTTRAHTDRVSTPIIVIMAGVAVAILAGAFMLFRPISTSVNPTPSISAQAGSSQATSAPTITVTVTAPAASASGKSSSAAGSSSSTASASQSPWPPTGTSVCDSQTAVNHVTSCGFAAAVLEVWTASGPGSYQIESPTTGQTYAMTCQQISSTLTRCSGGNNAEVYIQTTAD